MEEEIREGKGEKLQAQDQDGAAGGRVEEVSPNLFVVLAGD